MLRRAQLQLILKNLATPDLDIFRYRKSDLVISRYRKSDLDISRYRKSASLPVLDDQDIDLCGETEI